VLRGTPFTHEKLLTALDLDFFKPRFPRAVQALERLHDRSPSVIAMADFAVDLALIVSLLPVLFMFDAALACDVLEGRTTYRLAWRTPHAAARVTAYFCRFT
jgi:hypothetical protein